MSKKNKGKKKYHSKKFISTRIEKMLERMEAHRAKQPITAGLRIPEGSDEMNKHRTKLTGGKEHWEMLQQIAARIKEPIPPSQPIPESRSESSQQSSAPCCLPVPSSESPPEPPSSSDPT